MTDIAQLNQGRFYWVLVRASTKDAEWQPARFSRLAGPAARPKWDFIGFNGDVGHHFVEIVEIGPELDEDPLKSETASAAPAMDFLINRARPAAAGLPNHQRERNAPRNPPGGKPMRLRSAEHRVAA